VPEAASSPLVDLEAQLRNVSRRRREALREAEREGHLESPRQIAPGSWSELETTVYLEQAA
jgi:hypothetical protein